MRWVVKDGKGRGSAHASENAARGMYEAEIARADPGEKVSLHVCAHNAEASESTDQWYDCQDDPRAQYEETVKPATPSPKR